MWTISMLKQNAKAALKRYYWMAVLVTIIVALLGGNTGVSSSSSSSVDTSDFEELFDSGYSDYDDSYDDYDDYFADYYDEDNYEYYSNTSDTAVEAEVKPLAAVNYDSGYDDAFLGVLGGVFAVVFIVVFVIALAYSTFLGMPVTVGQYRFYLDARRGDVNVGKIFSQFKSGAYMPTIAAMFIMNLKIFLWSLLFLIPGMIKTYEYILVPYIMAENPYIDRKRAFEISRRTMEGEKFNCFVLQLSFIGWFFLGAITVIGGIFVAPYYNATMAEFYCCMREKALANGIASSYELPDNMMEDAMYPDQGIFTDSTSNVSGSEMTHYQPATFDSYQSQSNSAPQQYNGSSMEEIESVDYNSDDDEYKGPEIE